MRAVKSVRATMDSMEPLLRLLPNFRVVHLVRDPRAVALSRIEFDSSGRGLHTDGKVGQLLAVLIRQSGCGEERPRPRSRAVCIGATTPWDPWDASPPTLQKLGTKCIWSPPTFGIESRFFARLCGQPIKFPRSIGLLNEEGKGIGKAVDKAGVKRNSERWGNMEEEN